MFQDFITFAKAAAIDGGDYRSPRLTSSPKAFGASKRSKSYFL